VISLLAIIMGVAFYQNGNYQRDYDLGFATHGVISAWVNNEGAFNTYRDALASNKDIEVIAGSRHHVPFNFYNDPVKFGALEKEVDIMEVGDNYFEAMDMTLLSGRKFIKDSETDRKESVIVTEELVKQFGWTDNPIGKRLVWMDTTQLYVIGVAKNVFARALWQPIGPLMIRYVAPAKYQQLVVKTDPKKMASVNQLSETNEINHNVTVMFGFLGFFAALMTGIGLFTLVSLNIEKKMKEIGVRKVLGATIANIASVINSEFIINLGIATIIGGTLGYFASEFLMKAIWTYYLTLNYTSLSLSILAMIAIAIAAVGYKTISTASLNPTKTLRDE
jgi:ABC-type antimicrobial peptide transport system permease subunit